MSSGCLIQLVLILLLFITKGALLSIQLIASFFGRLWVWFFSISFLNCHLLFLLLYYQEAQIKQTAPSTASLSGTGEKKAQDATLRTPQAFLTLLIILALLQTLLNQGKVSRLTVYCLYFTFQWREKCFPAPSGARSFLFPKHVKAVSTSATEPFAEKQERS